MIIQSFDIFPIVIVMVNLLNTEKIKLNKLN